MRLKSGMKHNKEVVLEACDVLERHNRTGTPVMKFTVGKWTEMQAIRVVIESLRESYGRIEELEQENRVLENEMKKVKGIVDNW